MRVGLTARDGLLHAAGLAAAVVLAGLQTLLAYRTSPAIAAVAPVALATVALIAWRPIVGVYLGLLLAPFELFSLPLGGSAGLTPPETVFLVTAFFASAHLLFGSETIRAEPPFVAFAALLGVVALGLFFAEDALAVGKTLVMWSAFLALAMLVARSDRRQVENVLACIVVTAGALALVAVTQGGPQELEGGGAVVSNRAEGSFSHPNVLAFFLVLALPLALALGVHRGARLRPLMLGAGGLVALALILTLTRSAIIGAIVSLLLLLAWAPFRRLAGALLAAVLIFTALNLGAVSRSSEVATVSERLSTVAQPEATSGGRFAFWRGTPAIIADHPFLGVGEGNFSLAASRAGLVDSGGEPIDHAHNVPLTIAAELGLIGLAVLLWFVYTVAQTGVRALRVERLKNSPLALALLAALIAIGVVSLTDYPPRNNVIMALILLEAGALVRLAREDSPTPRLRGAPTGSAA